MQWQEHLTLKKNLYLNPVVSYSTLGKFVHSILFQFTQLYEMAKDTGGYLCTNSLHTLIVARLNVFQRSYDGVQLTRSDRK